MTPTSMREDLKEFLRSRWLNDENQDLVDGFLDWAARWRWRPTREQIRDCMARNQTPRKPDSSGGGRMEVYPFDVATEILSLYSAPQPKRVTRREIEKILSSDDGRFHIRIANEICALLGIEDEGPVWCKDLRPAKVPDGRTLWYFTNLTESSPMDVTWSFCPICGAPRPSQEERA